MSANRNSDTAPVPEASYQPLPPQDAPDAGRIILRDGRTAHLRRATGADADLLRAFLRQVSPEALSRRFNGGITIERAVQALLPRETPTRQVSLLVLSGGEDAPRVIATGCYAPAGGDRPQSAEVAILVQDENQNRGLGTLLLERLALIASHDGITRFVAETQADNHPMLEVFRQSGFRMESSRSQSTVSLVFAIEPTRESVNRSELRDRAATVASLRPLFRPRSVAVLGASRDPSAIGHRVLQSLIQGGFQGAVHPVNPHAREIAGLTAYASVTDIPGPVDLAVVAVPAEAVAGCIDDCGHRGVPVAVVLSAGFAETGAEGRRRQDALVARARGYGMRLVGPNCMGVLNTDGAVRLNASFSPVFPDAGPVAMSSQSGALGLAVLEYARQTGLGVASFVSIGNKADVSGNDLLAYWQDDPAVNVILLYLESFGNPRRFARLARSAARTKPVLAVKAGRTPAGQRAASSHTAALAAGEPAVEALFAQAGVIRADSLEDLFDMASLLSTQPLPAGPRVAVVTNAGGPAILAADALNAAGLELPEPAPDVQERLRSLLPPAASVRNPVDMIADATPEQYRGTVEAVMQDPGFDAVLVIHIPVGVRPVEEMETAIAAAVASARRAGAHKPVLACVMSGASVARPLVAGDESVPTYRFPEAAARALVRAHQYALWRATPAGEVPTLSGCDLSAARAVCRAAVERGGGLLTPAEVDAVLRAAGLPVIPSVVAPDARQAAEAASRLGFPAVVKLVARTLTHKSDVGGVELGLRGPEEVRAACGRIAAALEAAGQADELAGFLVQPQVDDGVELLVGVTQDPSFGPLIGFGLGGTWVEILRDIVFRITPLTDRDADGMVHAIRGFPLLAGYRGHPAADLDAVRDVLLRVSHLVEEVPEIAELDLNPVKALAPGEGGCRIVDARIRVRA
jgi:acetyl coenzyme A synthetase (ADP forming)-like protein